MHEQHLLVISDSIGQTRYQHVTETVYQATHGTEEWPPGGLRKLYHYQQQSKSLEWIVHKYDFFSKNVPWIYDFNLKTHSVRRRLCNFPWLQILERIFQLRRFHRWVPRQSETEPRFSIHSATPRHFFFLFYIKNPTSHSNNHVFPILDLNLARLDELD